MARRLTLNLSSDYIEAMNRLNGRNARRKVIAYVESFDDILFWSQLLRPLETEQCYFEVMLPSRTSLQKGKKSVLANQLGTKQWGKYMIACVDADYDYLLQGSSPASRTVCTSPYVFHTYAYAIENLQCYAPALHNVCVMSTLNDHRIFDFEAFIRSYSETIWPLFVWNVWAYKHEQHKHFSMQDFHNVVALSRMDYYHPERTIEALRHRVNSKVARLQQRFPQGKSTYKPLREQLIQLGVTPQTTYLYIRGHDLLDGIVAPLLQGVCDALRREREREIRHLAVHDTQKQNELASYQHSVAPVAEMLSKHTGYVDCPEYEKIQQDVKDFLADAVQSPENTSVPLSSSNS